MYTYLLFVGYITYKSYCILYTPLTYGYSTYKLLTYAKPRKREIPENIEENWVLYDEPTDSVILG